MKTALLTVGIIFLILGLIGVFSSYYVTWMWVLTALGVIGIIWGLLIQGKGSMNN